MHATLCLCVCMCECLLCLCMSVSVLHCCPQTLSGDCAGQHWPGLRVPVCLCVRVCAFGLFKCDGGTKGYFKDPIATGHCVNYPLLSDREADLSTTFCFSPSHTFSCPSCFISHIRLSHFSFLISPEPSPLLLSVSIHF